MTLDMLDLQHSPETKFYDAPLHVKALNGMLLIDDFGRQKFNPDELLNRWIVPMENQVDYLEADHRHELLAAVRRAADLLDEPAAGRFDGRRLSCAASSTRSSCSSRRARNTARSSMAWPSRAALTLSDDVFDFVVERLRGGGFGLAYYQPRFICDQVVEACKCFNMPPRADRRIGRRGAVEPLFRYRGRQQRGGAAAPRRGGLNQAPGSYWATQPPSIDNAAPVIVEAASPHRKTASAAIFSGVV